MAPQIENDVPHRAYRIQITNNSQKQPNYKHIRCIYTAKGTPTASRNPFHISLLGNIFSSLWFSSLHHNDIIKIYCIDGIVYEHVLFLLVYFVFVFFYFKYDLRKTTQIILRARGKRTRNRELVDKDNI